MAISGVMRGGVTAVASAWMLREVGKQTRYKSYGKRRKY